MEREKLTVLLNEADIRRTAEIAYSKDINKRLKRAVNISKISIIVLFFALLVLCPLLIIKDAQNANPAASGMMISVFAALAIIVGIVFVVAEIMRKRKLKRRAETYCQNELNRRKNGFLPRTYIFEKDGIHTCGRYSDFVVNYDELQECHEYADGLFFKYESGQVLWLPARFFTKSLAEEVSGAMKYVFMNNYFLHEKLSAPDAPEAVAEEQLIEPQGEADYIIEYKADKFGLLQRAVNAAIGKKMLVYVLIIFLSVHLIITISRVVTSLISKIGTPFNVNTALELCCVVFWLSCMVFFGITVINGLVLTPYRIYKAGAGWVRNGTVLELYENGIVEKIAAGRTFTPWDNLQTVLYSAGDLVTMDKTGRGIVIPESALKENREQTVNAIRKHLPHEHEHSHEHGHEHDESCSCGHEHHHENGEHCDCGHDHHEHDHHGHGEGCGCEECEGK